MRYLGLALLDIVLVTILVLVAILVSIFVFGPYSSPVMRSAFSIEVWLILVASIQPPLWRRVGGRLSRRIGAGVLGGGAGVGVFLVISVLLARLLMANGLLSFDLLSTLDHVGDLLGIVTAVSVSVAVLRPRRVVAAA